MEVQLSFTKTKISVKVIKMFETKILNEEDKKCLARILKGNKLSYKEANSFM